MDIIMLANISLVTINEGESNFECIESAALKMDKRSLISWHMLLRLVYNKHINIIFTKN